MATPLKVLCVEDSQDDATLLRLELQRAGYEVILERVETAPAMRQALQSRQWDVILSDYSMPQFSAPAALEVLHETGLDIPFIIVSGTIGEDAAVSALRAGAHDFFAKDKLVRLVPAVERELREAEERRERRQAELNLRRAQMRFSKVFQASPVGISITTVADQRYVDVNTSFLKMLGYSRDEVIGRTVAELGVLATSADPTEMAQWLREHRTINDLETQLRTRSGEKRDVLLSLEIIDVDDVPCALALMHDVTEHKRAEAAIRESEQQFRLLAENSTDMIARHTAEGIYLYVSPACHALIGYPPEELIGHSVYEFIHPDDMGAMVDAYRSILETAEVYSGYYRIRCKDGKYTWFESTSKAVRDPQTKRILEIQSASRDVSERVYAEEALSRFYQRLETLHTIDLAILSTRPVEVVAQLVLKSLLEQSSILGASIAAFDFETQTGLVCIAHSKAQDQIPAAAHFALSAWPEEDLAALQTGAVQVIEDLSILPKRSPGVRLLQQEGYRAFLRVPLIAKGELLGALNLAADSTATFTPEYNDIAREIAAQVAIAVQNAQLYDRTQRHAAELEQRVTERTAELQQAKERVETILNHSSDAIAMTWPDGMIQQTNPAFNRLMGYQDDEAVGQPLMPLSSPAEKQALADAIQRVVTDGETRMVEIDAYRSDGRLFDAEVVLSPIVGQDQQVSGIVCTVHDVTARNQVQRELEELNRLKTEFLSTAAHELRTPLTSIQGFSEILLTRKLPEDRAAYFLNLINSQARQLGSLINDLLDLSRLESQRHLSLELQPVNVQELLNETLTPFIETSPLHDFQVKGPQVWPSVIADRFRLGQVLNNLISNAVKYSPKGGTITIHGKVAEGSLRVSIQDQGIGLTREQQTHLFEKFYRADASNTGILGTGLGLSISKLIIELHGGRIWVESEYGSGTTVHFTLRLPRTEST
jgi:PAS domain S-box-containing protein